MHKTKKLTLIEGEFLPADAQEILMNIFSSKLNFHRLKNFSSQERFGTNDELAQRRIPELMVQVERLQEILGEAKEKNIKLRISSEIKISFSNDY